MNQKCNEISQLLQFIFYLPIMFYVLFAIVLLIYIIYIRIFQRLLPNLSQRLVYFTIVFVINWVFTVAGNMYDIVGNASNHGTKRPLFLLWINRISIASIGIQNALVWATSDLLKQSRFVLKQSLVDASYVESINVYEATVASSRLDRDKEFESNEFERSNSIQSR